MAVVLVVEDNPANLKLTSLLVKHAGHSVLAACDAKSGLDIARSRHPDLILMDVQLPDMDGLAVTRLLKQDPATDSIPIVCLTAMAMKDDEEKAKDAGCDAYIAKPIRYQELYKVINELLAQRASAPSGPWFSGRPA